MREETREILQHKGVWMRGVLNRLTSHVQYVLPLNEEERLLSTPGVGCRFDAATDVRPGSTRAEVDNARANTALSDACYPRQPRLVLQDAEIADQLVFLARAAFS